MSHTGAVPGPESAQAAFGQAHLLHHGKVRTNLCDLRQGSGRAPERVRSGPELAASGLRGGPCGPCRGRLSTSSRTGVATGCWGPYHELADLEGAEGASGHVENSSGELGGPEACAVVQGPCCSSGLLGCTRAWLESSSHAPHEYPAALVNSHLQS
jgi:hypothetical protein